MPRALAAAVFLFAAPAAAQDAGADPEIPPYRAALMKAGPLMAAGDYAAALPIAAEALPLAETDMERYQVRHMLTDLNGRTGNWAEAAKHAAEGKEILIASEELKAQERLAPMASHLAAEEGRAALMLGDEARMIAANAEAVDLHPGAASGWSAAEPASARHASGLECPFLVEDYLRFDLYGEPDGAPGCQYWNHDDIGVRIDVATAETADAVLAARLSELRFRDTPITPMSIALPGLPDGAQAITYRMGSWRPGLPERLAAIVTYPKDGETYVVSGRIPAEMPEDGAAAVARFLNDALDS